jgi:hypothetical protein
MWGKMFRHHRRLLPLILAAVLAVLVQPTIPAQAATTPADITLHRWDTQRDFLRGSWDNLRPSRDGAIEVRSGARTAAYTDPFGDGTARTYDVGSWTSPVVELGYAGDEAVGRARRSAPIRSGPRCTGRAARR